MSYQNDTGLPSVTEVISPFIDDRWYREEHQARGDAVHDVISKSVSRRFVPQYRNEDISGYHANFKQYVAPHIGEVFAVEARLICKSLGLTGQPDFIGVHGGQMSLIDWKSSASKQWWWVLQLAGYALLVDSNYPDLLVEKYAMISLQKTLDKPPLVVVKSAIEMAVFKTRFRSLLEIWHMGGGKKWTRKS